MASRFWVGSTGTWDASDTTHWAATSGGAGGQSVPGSGDTVTFDGSSGGGTVTVNFGGPITIQSLTMGAFTGTWDNSVNNNNFVITNNGNAFSITGSATRTIRLGSATYTLSGNTATFTSATTTGLTYTPGTSIIAFTGNGARTFNSSTGGTQVHGNVTVGTGNAAAGGSITFNNAMTIVSLSVTPPNDVVLSAGAIMTITDAVNWTASSSSQILFASNTPGTQATVVLTSGSVADWCAFYGVNVNGSTLTATNSFDLGGNNDITITSPGAGGSGGGGVIG
jgi:hypothetical protein